MSRFTKAIDSSIGRKVLMAVTGLGLIGFVIAHMVGNLQVLGPMEKAQEKLNAYAHMLQSLGPVLWIMRLGLLAMFVVHVATAFRLWRENSAARPSKYAVTQHDTSTMASRTMILSGAVVLAFAIYHILHFTLGAVGTDTYAGNMLPYKLKTGEEVHDVYRMVILGFRNPVVAVSYVVANLVLALHISHGASSVIQTLGFRNPRIVALRNILGPGLGALIAIGNCSIPVSILLGLSGAEVK